MARWTDQTAYPVLAELADDDRFPLLDVSDPSAEGGAQRQGTIAQLRAALGGTLDDLTDVDTTGATDGDRLVYDDGTWVPAPPASGEGDIALADGLVVVKHGANAATARPSAGSVYWQGSVNPTNRALGDLWLETGAYD